MKSERVLRITLSAAVAIASAFATDTAAQTVQSGTADRSVAVLQGTIRPVEEILPHLSNTVLTPRVGVQSGQTLPLTLADAIRRAIENNNEIEIAKTDVKIAQSSLRSLLGGYDPTFTTNPRYTNSVQPQTSTLGGADLSGTTRSNEFRFDSNVRTAIKPGGGDLTVSFNNNRQQTNFRFSQLNPTFNSTLGITYNQPLLKNRSIDATRRQVRIQRKRLDQSEIDFSRQTTDTVNQVQRAYWDLVFALRDQQNKTSNLNLAKENLRQIEAKITAGAAAPLQKAEIETELANRESDVLLAIQQVGAAENTLKKLIFKDSGSNEWGLQLVPTDKPAFSDDRFDLDAAVKEAVANRYELKRLQLESDINKIDQKYFTNQLRPQVDLTTTYNLVGVSGTLLGTAGSVPQRFIGGYGQALNNLGAGDTRTVIVGLTVSFPVLGRKTHADLATSKLQESRIAAQTRSQEEAVIVEVRNAVQAADTARQRVLAARRARENAEIQLEGERKLFEVGRSTQFLLFQRENSLANARNSEIKAETDYNKALADLQRVTSTTLIKNNIVIVDPKQDK